MIRQREVSARIGAVADLGIQYREVIAWIGAAADLGKQHRVGKGRCTRGFVPLADLGKKHRSGKGETFFSTDLTRQREVIARIGATVVPLRT